MRMIKRGELLTPKSDKDLKLIKKQWKAKRKREQVQKDLEARINQPKVIIRKKT